MNKVHVVLASILVSQCAVGGKNSSKQTANIKEERIIMTDHASNITAQSVRGRIQSKSDVQSIEDRPLQNIVVFHFPFDAWDAAATTNGLHLRAAGAGRASFSALIKQGGQYAVSDAMGYFEIAKTPTDQDVICAGQELQTDERAVEFIGCQRIGSASPLLLTIGIGGLDVKAAG